MTILLQSSRLAYPRGMTKRSLEQHPVHLGLGASAVAEPEYSGELAWYEGYGARHAADGDEGRLVALHTFSGSWSMWEMHPRGAEVVVCTAGTLTLVQELEGAEVRTTLEPGEYAINPAGAWHTADVEEHASALFITAGAGTEHRPR